MLGRADLTLPESTTIIEYLDGLAAGGPGLIPADPGDALQRHPSLGHRRARQHHPLLP